MKFHDLLQIPNKFTTDYLRAKRQVPTMSENMETAMLSMEMEKKEESIGPINIDYTTKHVGIKNKDFLGPASRTGIPDRFCLFAISCKFSNQHLPKIKDNTIFSNKLWLTSFWLTVSRKRNLTLNLIMIIIIMYFRSQIYLNILEQLVVFCVTWFGR